MKEAGHAVICRGCSQSGKKRDRKRKAAEEHEGVIKANENEWCVGVILCIFIFKTWLYLVSV